MVTGSRYSEENADFDLKYDGFDKWCNVSLTHNSRFVVSSLAT